MSENLIERVKREKDSYDKGKMKAENLWSLVPSLGCIQKTPSWQKFEQMMKYLIRMGKDKHILELGSQGWQTLIDFHNYRPQKLVCINISEYELLRGVEASKTLALEQVIDFLLMDAHFLGFADNYFDLVYGGAILHHLDIEIAIREIHRVLKPEGFMIFTEPLIHNPVLKLIRYLTPQTRTADEKPLGVMELRMIDQYFVTQNYYTQLFDIPLSIISSYIFKDPNNIITRFAYKIDSLLKKLPYIKYLYRYVLICGVKK
jgi:ubiquinone/menaquinone biosynthesis C-methylase UbiE